MIKQSDISLSPGRLYYYVIFIPIIILSYACPFSSPYKPGVDSPVVVDEALLGKWATMVTNKRGIQQPVKMILSKKNDTEYNIDFTGNFGDLKPYRIVRNDSIRGSAYKCIMADRQFLNIEIKGQTYISALIYNNDTLSLLALADGFTAKYIKSNSDLMHAIEVHFRTRLHPIFDEQFCLKQMTRVN